MALHYFKKFDLPVFRKTWLIFVKIASNTRKTFQKQWEMRLHATISKFERGTALLIVFKYQNNPVLAHSIHNKTVFI